MNNSSRTPNYRLCEDYSFGSSNYMSSVKDQKTIPAGSYVRPIKLEYLPNHVLEDHRWRYTNKDTHIFCYTRFGIVPIPKTHLRDE